MSDLPPLFCVTGPDGAGKTTQVQRLVERLEANQKHKVAAVTIWDLLLDPKTRDRVGFKDLREVDAYLSMLHPVSRALFCFHCIHQALELSRAKEPELLIVDSYWYKYYATEIAHGGDPAKLRSLTSIFPEPVMTFYLSLSPTQAFHRKQNLSGYETGFGAEKTESSFKNFQEVSARTLADLCREFRWVSLDGTESVEALTETIGSRIEDRLRS